jgi:hypothetical protein
MSKGKKSQSNFINSDVKGIIELEKPDIANIDPDSGLILGSEAYNRRQARIKDEQREKNIKETEKKMRKERAEDIKIWKKAFEDWKKDDTRIKEFADTKQTPLYKEDLPKVLVEAFVYVPEKVEGELIGHDTGLMGLDAGLTANQQNKLKSLPFVKILWSEDEKEIGKIYSVPDGLAQVTYNDKYDEWMALRAEKPSMEGGERPPRFKSGWAMWASHNYMINKFQHEPSFLDYFTFLIPRGNLKTESNL